MNTEEKRKLLEAPITRAKIAKTLKIHPDSLRRIMVDLNIRHSRMLTQRELNQLEEYYFGR